MASFRPLFDCTAAPSDTVPWCRQPSSSGLDSWTASVGPGSSAMRILRRVSVERCLIGFGPSRCLLELVSGLAMIGFGLDTAGFATLAERFAAVGTAAGFVGTAETFVVVGRPDLMVVGTDCIVEMAVVVGRPESMAVGTDCIVEKSAVVGTPDLLVAGIADSAKSC